MLADKCVVVQLGVTHVDAVDLLHLSGPQLLFRIEAPSALQETLAAEDFVEFMGCNDYCEQSCWMSDGPPPSDDGAGDGPDDGGEGPGDPGPEGDCVYNCLKSADCADSVDACLGDGWDSPPDAGGGAGGGGGGPSD